MKKITTLLFLSLSAIFLFSYNLAENTNPALIKVEGGNFTMGSKKSDVVADNDEQKEHEVKVNSFYISKFEVTVWEWKQFTKANKLTMPPKPAWGWHDNYPINNITWEEAIAYCNWLSQKEKLTPVYSKKGPNYNCNFKADGYRLPTEAEWEYAAKGGKVSIKTKYSGSDEADKIAWHQANSKATPHTVGTKLPNELGLYDMSGNVWEWCWDWYNQDYYLVEAGNNPKGPEMGERRSVRGGSWDSKLNYLRPANRISTYPNKMHEFYGFRVVRSIVE
jgi:formylglycine-generating enzyme required for sulfatase activity